MKQKYKCEYCNKEKPFEDMSLYSLSFKAKRMICKLCVFKYFTEKIPQTNLRKLESWMNNETENKE